MRQAPEELMSRQATAREFGRSEATEEAGQGTGGKERVGLLAAQEGGLVPDGIVNADRRVRWQAERTAVGEAPGTMIAGRGEHLAEVGAELRHLAAVVGGQLQHLVQTRQFACFAVEGTRMQGLGYG